MLVVLLLLLFLVLQRQRLLMYLCLLTCCLRPSPPPCTPAVLRPLSCLGQTHHAQRPLERSAALMRWLWVVRGRSARKLPLWRFARVWILLGRVTWPTASGPNCGICAGTHAQRARQQHPRGCQGSWCTRTLWTSRRATRSTTSGICHCLHSNSAGACCFASAIGHR